MIQPGTANQLSTAISLCVFRWTPRMASPISQFLVSVVQVLHCADWMISSSFSPSNGRGMDTLFTASACWGIAHGWGYI